MPNGNSLGAEADAMAPLVSRYFGMRAFGAVYGACFGVFSLGMAKGPLLMVYGFDLTHSYSSPRSVLLLLLAAAVAVTAKLPKYEAVTATRSQRTFPGVSKRPAFSIRAGQ